MLTVLAFVVGITAVAAVWGGIVLKVLWGWIVVPTFEMAELSLPAAIGVGLVVSFLTHQYVPTKDEDLPEILVHELLYPLIALVMGFVVHLFI